MARELIYTSTPTNGIRQGTGNGFCTVVQTMGLSRPLVEFLEQLSNHYKEIYKPSDPRAAQNPVTYSHVRAAVGGQGVYVLSRNAAAGADHTGRTNNLAQHLVLDNHERPDGGPAWLARQPGVFVDRWNGQVSQTTARSVPVGDRAAAVCELWGRYCGNAGWGGVVADALLKGESLFLIVPPDCPTLALIEESLALLTPLQRWSATFSTYYTSLPAGVTCAVRAVYSGTPAEAEARRGRYLDLSTLRHQELPNLPLVLAAQTGEPALEEPIALGELEPVNRPAIGILEPQRQRPTPNLELVEPLEVIRPVKSEEPRATVIPPPPTRRATYEISPQPSSPSLASLVLNIAKWLMILILILGLVTWAVWERTEAANFRATVNNDRGASQNNENELKATKSELDKVKSDNKKEVDARDKTIRELEAKNRNLETQVKELHKPSGSDTSPIDVIKQTEQANFEEKYKERIKKDFNNMSIQEVQDKIKECDQLKTAKKNLEDELKNLKEKPPEPKLPSSEFVAAYRAVIPWTAERIGETGSVKHKLTFNLANLEKTLQKLKEDDGKVDTSGKTDTKHPFNDNKLSSEGFTDSQSQYSVRLSYKGGTFSCPSFRLPPDSQNLKQGFDDPEGKIKASLENWKSGNGYISIPIKVDGKSRHLFIYFEPEKQKDTTPSKPKPKNNGKN